MASSTDDGHGRERDPLRAEIEGLALAHEAGPDVDALFAEVSTALRAERGIWAFLRSRSTAARVGIVIATVAVLVAIAALRLPRVDIAVYPHSRMLLSLLTIGALGATCLALGLRPLQLAPPPAWLSRWAPLAAVFGLAILYLLPEASDIHPASLNPPGLGPTVLRALPCFIIGTVLALPFLTLLISFERGGAGRATLLTASAGLLANFLLQVSCPVTAPLHMLLGHFGVLLLAFATMPLVARGLQ